MANKIYISGKMGEKVLSQATKEKFARAEEKLRGEGWSYVQNPASDDFQRSLYDYISYRNGRRTPEADIMLFDIGLLAECDAIYMLRDWRESPGATAEHYFAKAIGIKIIYEDESNT
jgi:hypothetical protein